MADALEWLLTAKDNASEAVGRVGESARTLGEESDTTGGKLGGLGSKLGELGKIAGAAVLGGLGAVAGILAESTKKAAEDQVSHDILTNTLKNAIPVYGANAVAASGMNDAIDATIAKNASLGFASDETQRSLNTLVGVTHSVTQAQQLESDALDLARAKNIPLTTATKDVTMAFEGKATALAKLGILVPKHATNMQILTAITDQTKGAAQSFADTASGSMDAFGTSLDLAEVKVGDALLPALSGLAGMLVSNVLPAMGRVADAVSGWVTANQPLISGIEHFVAGALAGLIDGLFTKLVPAIGNIAGLIGGWVSANQPLISQIEGVLNGAVRALGDGVKWASDNMQIVVPFIAGALVVAFGAWAISAGAAAAATALALAPILAVGAAIGLLAVAWTQNWGGIQDKVQSVIAIVGPVIGTLIADVQGIIAAIAPVVGQIASWVGQFVAWFTSSDGLGPKIAGAIGTIVTVITGVVNAIAPVVSGIATFVGQVIAWFTSPSGLGPMIASAIGAIITVVTGVVNAVMPVVSGIAGFVGQVIGFFTGPGSLQDKVSGAVTAVIGFVTGIPGMLLGLVGQFLSAAGQLGQAIVNGILGALGNLPKQVGDILNSIPGVSLIGGIAGNVVNAATTVGGAAVGAVGGAVGAVTHKASGGFVPLGGMARVGEIGMETVRAVPGGVMVENSPGGRAGGSGGGVTINGGFHPVINSSSTDPADVAEQVMQAFKREVNRQGMALTAGTF